MACSSCRKSPVQRVPSSNPGSNGGIILPKPSQVNRTPMPTTGDARTKITGLRYAPK